MNCVLPKSIGARLLVNWVDLTNKKINNRIMMRYLKIIWYSTNDICCPNSLKRITRIKSRTCTAFKHPKIVLCHVKINFHMFWTILLKKSLARQNMRGFTWDNVLLSKLLKSKSYNEDHPNYKSLYNTNETFIARFPIKPLTIYFSFFF
jgi:hypothetical protein